MRDDCYTVRCLKGVLQTEVLRDVVRDNILFSLVWNLVLIMVIVRDNVLFLQVWSLVLIMVIQTVFFGGGVFFPPLAYCIITSNASLLGADVDISCIILLWLHRCTASFQVNYMFFLDMWYTYYNIKCFIVWS